MPKKANVLDWTNREIILVLNSRKYPNMQRPNYRRRVDPIKRGHLAIIMQTQLGTVVLYLDLGS